MSSLKFRVAAQRPAPTFLKISIILEFLHRLVGAALRRLSQNPKKGLNLKFGRIQDSPLQRISELR